MRGFNAPKIGNGQFDGVDDDPLNHNVPAHADFPTKTRAGLSTFPANRTRSGVGLGEVHHAGRCMYVCMYA